MTLNPKCYWRKSLFGGGELKVLFSGGELCSVKFIIHLNRKYCLPFEPRIEFAVYLIYLLLRDCDVDRHLRREKILHFYRKIKVEQIFPK